MKLSIELRGAGVLREDRWILRDVSWTVPEGVCAAILGPNGSGKSTLARIVSGHLWPTEGRISVLGGTFGETNLPELRQRIRMVQPAGPYDVDPSLTAEQVVETGFFSTLALYDEVTEAMRERARAVLGEVGLSAVATHPYSTLSSGERVRSLIARALVSSPRLLILDEPTAGMDLLGREQVLATVRRLMERPDADRPTVLMITHHTEELLPGTDHILLLEAGRVAASGPMEQVLREDVLSRVYGVPVHVRNRAGRYYLEVSSASWEGLLGRNSLPKG